MQFLQASGMGEGCFNVIQIESLCTALGQSYPLLDRTIHSIINPSSVWEKDPQHYHTDWNVSQPSSFITVTFGSQYSSTVFILSCD